METSVNGHGAVDLGALKAAAQQRQELEAQREPLIAQLLTQAGLQCQCGNRIRGQATIYFAVIEQPVPTPQGEVLGLNLMAHTCCSRTCTVAIMCEGSAIARRDGPTGRIHWLDERRAARAARQ